MLINAQTQPGARVMSYIPKIDTIAVGYENGIISLYPIQMGG